MTKMIKKGIFLRKISDSIRKKDNNKNATISRWQLWIVFVWDRLFNFTLFEFRGQTDRKKGRKTLCLLCDSVTTL